MKGGFAPITDHELPKTLIRSSNRFLFAGTALLLLVALFPTAKTRITQPRSVHELVEELFLVADIESVDHITEFRRGMEEPINPAMPAVLRSLKPPLGKYVLRRVGGSYSLVEGQHQLNWSFEQQRKGHSRNAVANYAKHLAELGFNVGKTHSDDQAGGTQVTTLRSDRQRGRLAETVKVEAVRYEGNLEVVKVEWTLGCPNLFSRSFITASDLAKIEPRLATVKLHANHQVLYEQAKDEPLLMSVLSSEQRPISWWEVRVHPIARAAFEDRLAMLGFNETNRFNQGAQVFWEDRKRETSAAIITAADGKTIRLRCTPMKR